MAETRLVVCVNERLGPGKQSCAGSGSRDLIELLQQRFNEQGLDIEISEQVCLGRCAEGVAMRIAPGGPFFTQVLSSDLDQIVSTIKNFKPTIE